MFENLFKGNERSIKAKKNVFASVVIKGADTLVYLLLVPLTLGYLNSYEYGIWLTLNSLLMWIDSFDIGLGNGLRNKLAIAIAENDRDRGRCYISTTFFMLIFIMILLLATSTVIINIVNWYSLLNVDVNVVGNIREIVFVSFLFFCLNFVLKFIGNVYQALQLPAVNYMITFFGHLLSLVAIYLLKQMIPGNLFLVAIIYSAAPPLVYLICYPITFVKLYPCFSPSFCYFRKEYLKDLLTLSLSFFVLQIMGIVLFALTNLIISNMFGPDQVTPYNIAYRYFSIILILFNMFLAPIWSATTDAYEKNDLDWIVKSLHKIRKVFFLSSGVIIVMILVSDYVYKIWVGGHVVIPMRMSVLMGVYNMILLYSLSYSSFLMGMGKLRLQLYNTCVVTVLFYPICSFFAIKYDVIGILVGMCLVHLSGAVLNTIQLHKLLKRNATGIWTK